jgi:hypothetical protein
MLVGRLLEIFIETPVSGQKKKVYSPKSRTEPANDRYRRRLHITLDPQVYEWLKKSTDNASRLIESLVNAVSHGIQPLAFVISGKTKPGPGFEPGSVDLQSTALPLCHPGLEHVAFKLKKILVSPEQIQDHGFPVNYLRFGNC